MFMASGMAARAQDTSGAPWIHSSIANMAATNIPIPSEASRDPDLILRSLTAGTWETSPVALVKSGSIATLVTADAESNTLDTAQALILLEDANKLYRAGAVAEAIGHLTTGLSRLKKPDALALLYERIGIMEFRQGNFEKAADFFRSACDLRPTANAPRLNLAAALMSAGRYSEAERAIRLLVVSSSQDPTMRFSICFNMACIRSMEGNAIDALLWLWLAAREDALGTLASLSDAQLDPIRDQQGFQAIRESLRDYKPDVGQDESVFDTGLKLVR